MNIKKKKKFMKKEKHLWMYLRNEVKEREI